VFVTGATGVLGRSAVAALVGDGHDVSGLARTEDKALVVEAAGATPLAVNLFDVEELTDALAGYDAVCNLATCIPIGANGMRPGAWRINDRIRTEGSRIVATAARAAGVRRLVQESISTLYADGGDEWLTEESPLSVTRATEPVTVAEANAQEYGCSSRVAVVLRFGNFVGDDAFTRWRLARARSGHAIGLGDPQAWTHLIHPLDSGAAVAAAVTAPAGVYNVGAEPVTRADFVDTFARAVGRDDIGFVPRVVQRLARERLEPLTRSQRISSALFHEVTGWKPTYDVFDESWLEGVL
jgi:nucleoside-diphosphate-sugar epimerase